MPTTTAFSVPTDNRLLAALPRSEYELLMPHLHRVQLPQGKVLFEAGDPVRYAHFPMSGAVSLLSTTEDGETVEAAMVGNEGMTGVPIVLRVGLTPYRSMVQISGEALRIKADALRTEFNRNGQLQNLLLRYTHTLLVQVSQSAVCNRFHTVDARLCRWLLVTHDRVRSETFYLTQEFISQMLGTPRTVVTIAANKLQDKGLIRYKRGRITILNRQGLESAACECYGVLIKEISNFIAA